MTFITLYLLIGFFFLFMLFCATSKEGITGDHVLSLMKPDIAMWFIHHPNMYGCFMFITAIGILLFWPYVLYVLYKNKDNYE